MRGMGAEASRSRRQEALRAAYRPQKVAMLFVGESPPASGRFFYERDSGLYRVFRDAFQVIDGSIDDENFLKVFQQAGCYLIDLCSEPVDRMEPAARRDACRAAEPVLSRKVRALRPETLVTLVRSIRENVERAAFAASWKGSILTVPYPGRWVQHRKIFMELLLPQLKARLESTKEARN